MHPKGQIFRVLLKEKNVVNIFGPIQDSHPCTPLTVVVVGVVGALLLAVLLAGEGPGLGVGPGEVWREVGEVRVLNCWSFSSIYQSSLSVRVIKENLQFLKVF